MKQDFLFAACVVFLSSSIGAYADDFAEGDTVSFRRDTFVYANNLQSSSPLFTALSGDNATIRESFMYRRSPGAAFDSVNNPNVPWVRVVMGKDSRITGSFPLEDGTSNGPPLVMAVPTGSFLPPLMEPSPTIIFAIDTVKMTISPEISHSIEFRYETFIRRTGTNDEWLSVGDPQKHLFETGKSYSRYIRIPSDLTTGLSENLSLDLKTVISFGDEELSHVENTGGIIVRPKPLFSLTAAHFDESGKLAATLNGIDLGRVYWVEWSSDMKTWTPSYSFTGAVEGQPVSIPATNDQQKFLRVSAE